MTFLHSGKQQIIEMIRMNTVHDDEFNVQCCPDDKANVDDFSLKLKASDASDGLFIGIKEDSVQH